MITNFELRLLGFGDIGLMRSMLLVFGDAFEDLASFTQRQPNDEYMNRLLDSKDFIAVACLSDGKVVAGITAYCLHKYEQAIVEVYIYDLAVDKEHRRKGIATSLIKRVLQEAESRGARVVFVQAEPTDEAAVALYSKLGVRHELLHFVFEPD